MIHYLLLPLSFFHLTNASAEKTSFHIERPYNAVDEEEDFEDLDFLDTSDLNITNHEAEIEGQSFSYTAITGMCPISNKGKVIAELFFIAYLKNDENENRPITFFFPGGPGGAGTIESILTFGPKRLLTPKEGKKITPPYQLIDNPETLLQETDLVFVDPAGSGFSKILDKNARDFCYSLEGDIQILTHFIENCLMFSERWNSPLYLAGGSYGTLRCCGVAERLFYNDIPIQGMILNGCAFEFSTLVSGRDSLFSYALSIPTFAATAWYHHRAFEGKPLEEVLSYARKFTYETYLPFMLQPSRLSYAEKLRVEKEFAYLIGLREETVRRYGNRINEPIYTQEFFYPERKVLGGTDTRYSGDVTTIDPDKSHDPSYLDCTGITPPFLNYLQKNLQTSFQFQKYVGFSNEAFAKWDYSTYDTFGIPGLLQRIRRTLVLNPEMKIFVGSGYYDCRTPFAGAEYCFDHLDLPESYKNRIQLEYYHGGHGFIFDHPSLQKFKNDLQGFYKNKSR